MKKRKKGLIAGIFFLILLLILYFILRNMNQEEEKETETKKKTVFETKEEDITSVKAEFEGENYEFIHEGDQWFYKEDEKFPLDAELLKEKLSSVTSVDSMREIKEPENLEDFGLKNPEVKVTIKEAEDKETVLSFGDVNEAVSGCYMMINEDESQIYLVDSSAKNAMKFNLEDLADKEEIPSITSTTIKKITVEEDGKTRSLIEEENEAGWTFTDENSLKQTADSSLVSQFISSFSSLSWKSYVTYDLSDLSKYGLDNPIRITIDYQLEEDNTDSEEDNDLETSTSGEEKETKKIVEKQLVLLLGAKDSEGNYYGKQESDTCIYTLPSDIAEKLLNMKTDDFLSKKVSDYSFADMDKVIFQKGNETYIATKQTVEKESSDEETATETKYMINDKEIEMSDFSDFYNKITALEWQSLDKGETPEKEPEMSITFEKEDGIQVTTDYYSYDSNFYLVIDSKGSHMLVNKIKAKEIIESFDSMITSWNQK